MKLLLLSLIQALVILPAAAQMQYFPEHFTGKKGFHRCTELFSSHIKGQTDTIPQLNAIHYFDAMGNDTAIQYYLNDTLLAERRVIAYLGDKIIYYKEYGGTNYDDTSDHFDPTILRSTTIYKYRNDQLIYIQTATDRSTTDKYLIYDSLGRRKKVIDVSRADGVIYTYKLKGKAVTADRDTILMDYSYSGLNVVERMSGNGKPTGCYEYTYNEKDKLIKLVYSRLGKILQSTSYIYDDQGYLVETTNQEIGPAHGVPYLPITRTVSRYHLDGRLLEQISYTRKGIFINSYKYE